VYMLDCAFIRSLLCMLALGNTFEVCLYVEGGVFCVCAPCLLDACVHFLRFYSFVLCALYVRILICVFV